MKIAVAGLGDVGLSNAAVLAQQHEVVALDIDEQRVRLVTERRSPIDDPELAEHLATRELRLSAITDPTSRLCPGGLRRRGDPQEVRPGPQILRPQRG